MFSINKVHHIFYVSIFTFFPFLVLVLTVIVIYFYVWMPEKKMHTWFSRSQMRNPKKITIKNEINSTQPLEIKTFFFSVIHFYHLLHFDLDCYRLLCCWKRLSAFDLFSCSPNDSINCVREQCVRIYDRFHSSKQMVLVGVYGVSVYGIHCCCTSIP